MKSENTGELENKNTENTSNEYKKLIDALSISRINFNENYLIIALSFIFYCYIILKVNNLNYNLDKISKLTADHRESIHLLLKSNLNNLYNNCVNLNDKASNITNFILFDPSKIILDNN